MTDSLSILCMGLAMVLCLIDTAS